MADLEERAENTAESTPPVDGSEEQTNTQDDTTQNDATVSEESNETEAVQEQDSKEAPTRSPRTEKRISKLTAKLNSTFEENRRLREQVNTQTAAETGDPSQLNNTDERVRRLEEVQTVDKVDKDLRMAELEYPQLNPDSNDYDPKLAEHITNRVEREVFQKGNFDVKGEIDDIMSLVSTQSKKYATRVNEEVSEDSKRSGVPTGNSSKAPSPGSYEEIVKKHRIGSPEYKQAVRKLFS